MSVSTIPAPASHRRLLVWLPTLVWLALIAWFSSDFFSSAHTGRLLLKIIHLVYGDISEQNFQIVHFLVRKAAHLTVYGTLGGLAYYSWRATLPANGWGRLHWITFASAMALLAGSLDEFHQSFVASRGPSPYDVLLDLTGALLVQLAITVAGARAVKSDANEPDR